MRGLLMSSLLVFFAAGCTIETPAAQPAPPTAPPPVVQPQQVAAAPPMQSRAHRPMAIEAGYEHCCGDERYRLEIGCGYSELRCYQRTANGWQRTYGRHCKEQLGMACYLNGCNNRCQ